MQQLSLGRAIVYQALHFAMVLRQFLKFNRNMDGIRDCRHATKGVRLARMRNLTL